MPCTRRRCLPATYLTIGALKTSAPLEKRLGAGHISTNSNSRRSFQQGSLANRRILMLPYGSHRVGCGASNRNSPSRSALRSTALLSKTNTLPEADPVWTDRDLAKCGALATALQEREITFRHLDAAQLLKHALGLHNRYQGSFTLVYLYANQDAPEAEQHRNEIITFGSSIDGDFPFVAVSYNTFLKKLHLLSGAGHDH
jgi:hypothetical protein